MSRATSGVRSDRPTGASRPQIYYYEDHVTIRIKRRDWDEGLEKHAKSANTSIDQAARAAWKASEGAGPIDDSGAGKATHPVMQSDPRDEIPLVNCSRTRFLISAIGCMLAGGAIAAVTLATNNSNAADFKPLVLPNFKSHGESDAVIGALAVGAPALTVVFIWLIYEMMCKPRN